MASLLPYLHILEMASKNMVYYILVGNATFWQCLSFETTSYVLIDSFVVKTNGILQASNELIRGRRGVVCDAFHSVYSLPQYTDT